MDYKKTGRKDQTGTQSTALFAGNSSQAKSDILYRIFHMEKCKNHSQCRLLS